MSLTFEQRQQIRTTRSAKVIKRRKLDLRILRSVKFAMDKQEKIDVLDLMGYCQTAQRMGVTWYRAYQTFKEYNGFIRRQAFFEAWETAAKMEAVWPSKGLM